MIYISDFKKGALLYDALNSEIRLAILEEIMHSGKQFNLAYLAQRFQLTGGAVTTHIKKLQLAGLIEVDEIAAAHGIQKICRSTVDRVVIDFMRADQNQTRSESVEIDVGSYDRFKCKPPCGIATREMLIGTDEAAFRRTAHYKASILWMSSGYVEYEIPHEVGDNLLEIRFTLEISSSAAVRMQYFPSDVYFTVNERNLGFFRCEGEYFDRPGKCSPQWWSKDLVQYGKPLMLSVDGRGVYVNSLRVSDVTLADLNIQTGKRIKFGLVSTDRAAYCGGFTLFGNGFGDSEKGIVCDFIYKG